MARIIADDIELEYHSLSLVKIYKGDYVYAADMDGRFEHEAVSVAADGDGRHTFVYSSKKANETVCFISEELDSWRYDFYLFCFIDIIIYPSDTGGYDLYRSLSPQFSGDSV